MTIALASVAAGALAFAGETSDFSWEGRRVAFLGDSITDKRHIGCATNYWGFLSDWMKFDAYVYGVNGARSNHLPRQIKAMQEELGEDVDAVFVFIGTNDYNGGDPLGEWYEQDVKVRGEGEVTVKERKFSTDEKTFRGRMNVALRQLKTDYPESQVILMTPIHRAFAMFGPKNVQPPETFPNRLGLYVESYVDVVREAGRIWSCPVIDLYAESGLVPILDSNTRYFANAKTDRLHPGTEGHRRIAALMMQKMKTLPATFRKPGAFSAAGVQVNGRLSADVERRDFADGFAVRYRLPDGVATVACERTEWRLPAEAKVWYQPECAEYEHSYVTTTVGEIPYGTRINLPVTAKLPDGTYRMLTEANVVDYTDSSVEYRGAGRFAIRYYADKGGFVRSGVPHTPWRVTLVAKDLQTLATSDIVRRLCPDPTPAVAAACAKFVKPGRCVWQWLPDNSPKYAEQKAWYDRTKALGFEYYLIDDGWRDWRDGDLDQWACLKKWIDYGKSIGVETFMWVHSKEMLSAVTRRPYLEKVKAAGAVGIKIDFMPPASCKLERWYEETLAETLEFGLMTDFHGAVKPSGRERTWPHEIAREAIRGHEWHITRYNRVLPPEHDCILPFNRLVQGPADYTPVVFEKKELQGYTWARELAQGVIFAAPFLCFGDYPQNYLDNPAAEMIKALPAVYDETRILPGSEIGECIAVAKRKGKDWFVAVENGAVGRRLVLKLGFLGVDGGELVGFADAPDRPDGYAVERRSVVAGDVIKLNVRPCGGYAAWIRGN